MLARSAGLLVIVAVLSLGDAFGPPLRTVPHVIVKPSKGLLQRIGSSQQQPRDVRDKTPSNDLPGLQNGAISPLASLMMMLPVLMCLTTLLQPSSALAASKTISSIDAQNMANIFDPANFQPVCPGSDGVYQVLKYAANTLVGQENVVEYGPLIASVLLRVRLELCVLESFLYEAVVPFVRTKGLSWVLPLHESVETVLAGTIFAVASNFVLLGSTKILSVLFIYADALTGMPARFLGGQAKQRLKGVGSTVCCVGSSTPSPTPPFASPEAPGT